MDLIKGLKGTLVRQRKVSESTRVPIKKKK